MCWINAQQVRGQWVDISAAEWRERLGGLWDNPPELPEGSPNIFKKGKTDLIFVSETNATALSHKDEELTYLSLSTRTRVDDDENVIAVQDGYVSCAFNGKVDVAFVTATLQSPRNEAVSTTASPVTATTAPPSFSEAHAAITALPFKEGPPPNFNAVGLPDSISVRRRLGPVPVSKFDIRISPGCSCQRSPSDKSVYQVDCPPDGVSATALSRDAPSDRRVPTPSLRGSIVLPETASAGDFLMAQIVMPALFTITRA